MPLKGFRTAPVNSRSQWRGLLLLLQQRPLGTQVCNVHSSTHPFFSITANPAPRVAGAAYRSLWNVHFITKNESFQWRDSGGRHGKKKACFVVNVINHMYSCDVAENTRLQGREKGPSGL